VSGKPLKPEDLQPCGTPAAARRHRWHGQPLCDDCRAVENERRNRRRRKTRATDPPKEHEIRDPLVPYRYRARTYPWAVRVLDRAEAVWGRPDDEEAA
jgi:hypothetical protein